MDEKSDPSQPSRFISEALRVASSIEQHITKVRLPSPYNAVHRVNLVKM
jgi:hypothetical protein